MIKVAIDDGHGLETSGKRTPAYEDGHIIHEKQFNMPAANFAIEALDRCGFDTLDVAPGTKDIPLKQRTDAANDWGADAFASVHYNAQDSAWGGTTGGIEVYYYPGSVKGKKLAEAVYNRLIEGTEMPGRGVKEKNFHVCRETNMPAILCECGFMDVRSQADLMLKEAYQKETGEEIAHGVCDYFGVAYNEEDTPSNPYYEVLIKGDNFATADYLWGYAEAHGNHSVPPEVPQIYLEISKRYGIRGDIAFCQALKETNFFLFTGVAQYEWHNPCGLGVTGDPGVGCRFDSWEDGVLAHIQHLAVYSGISSEDFPDPIIDSRHAVSARAEKWRELNGQWAVPGTNYGQEIMDIYVAMAKSQPVAIPQQQPEETDHDETIEKLMDEVADLTKELIEKNETIKERDNQINQLAIEAGEESMELKQTVDALQKKNTMQQGEIDTAKGQAEVLKQTVEDLTKQNEELEAAKNAKNDVITSQAELSNRLQAKLEDCETAKRELQSMYGALMNEKNILEGQIQSLEEQLGSPITREALKKVSFFEWLDAQIRK